MLAVRAVNYSKLKKYKTMTNLDVVKKLVGKIRPVGESNTDAERFENLKAMCELANDLIKEIDAVGYDFKDDHQGSIRKCSDYAQKFLTETVGIGS